MTASGNEIDALVAGAARVRDQDLDADAHLRVLLAEIGGQIASAPEPGRRRLRLPVPRWPALPLIAGAIAVVLIVVGPVLLLRGSHRDEKVRPLQTTATPRPTPTRSGVPLHTGRFGEPGMTESDTSEWLDLNSPELPAGIDTYGREFPLPPGGDWSYAKRPVRGGGLMQVTGLRQELADNARCQWEYYWLDGHTKDDMAQMDAARRALDGMPNWPIFKQHESKYDRTSFRGVLDGIGRGDPTLLEQVLEAQCTRAMYPGGAK